MDALYVRKLFRVKIRRFTDFKVRPEAEAVDGVVAEFLCGWVIEDGDCKALDCPWYFGETAWIAVADNPKYPWPRNAPAWIASGDLEELT